ncbi:hypothetical protein K3495_g11980 [Podosphaera aphanis]|nr:hypothetical protein K3495_g11980 [Podosphaera aphanis]
MLSKITEDRPTCASTLKIRCSVLLAFAGFLRMGEITWTQSDHPSSQRFFDTKVTRSCVRFSECRSYLTLHLKRSKTDDHNERVFILIAANRGSSLCPVTAMEELFAQDPQPPAAFLFSLNGAAFTKQSLQGWLTRSLFNKGLNPETVTLHSFRQGACQHAKDSGIRDDQIQDLGRWTSLAFHRYFTTSQASLCRYQRRFQLGRPASLPFPTS